MILNNFGYLMMYSLIIVLSLSINELFQYIKQTYITNHFSILMSNIIFIVIILFLITLILFLYRKDVKLLKGFN